MAKRKPKYAKKRVSRPKKKKTTTRKTKKKPSRSTKTLSKKFSHYTSRTPIRRSAASRHKLNSDKSMQPSSRKNSSDKPADLPSTALTEYKAAEQHYKKAFQSAPTFDQKNKVAKLWQGVKKGFGKVGAGADKLIEGSVKALEKSTDWATRAAGPMNAFAAATENPLVIGAAGFVDTLAGANVAAHAIDHTMDIAHGKKRSDPMIMDDPSKSPWYQTILQYTGDLNGLNMIDAPPPDEGAGNAPVLQLPASTTQETARGGKRQKNAHVLIMDID